MVRKPKLGVALSGGGARGITHIGVLKALAAHNIEIDYLAGTSMGGVIAAALAAGNSPEDIEEVALNFKNTRELLKLVDPGIPGAGIFQGEQLLKFFTKYFGDLRFDQLEIPLGLVAVDIKQGEEIHILEGSINRALRATVSVPGLIAPVDDGEQRLVDGGLLNNLPVDLAYEMGADLVIAVDVMAATTDESYWHILGNKRILPGKIGGMVTVLGDSLNLLIQQQNKMKLEQNPPTFLLEPNVSQEISIVSGFHRVDEMVSEGFAVTEQIVDQLKSQLHLAAADFKA
ncbi:MAG: patatin-like phospholipase family protein [Chloroflexota bacterium]